MKKIFASMMVLMLAVSMLTGAFAEDAGFQAVVAKLESGFAAVKAEAQKAFTDSEAEIHKAIADGEAALGALKAAAEIKEEDISEESKAEAQKVIADFEAALSSVKAEADKLEAGAGAAISEKVKALKFDFAIAKLWVAMEAVSLSADSKEAFTAAVNAVTDELSKLKASVETYEGEGKEKLSACLDTLEQHFTTLVAKLGTDGAALTDEIKQGAADALNGIKDGLGELGEHAETVKGEVGDALGEAAGNVEAQFDSILSSIFGK